MYLLFLLALAQAALFPLEPVKLPLAGNTVTLLVGNPGAKLVFYVNFTHPGVVFHRSLAAISQTVHTRYDSTGTEIFYIDKYRLRLPFEYAPPLNDDIDMPYAYAATLGLGAKSPMWRYWDNMTVSADHLTLGMYDYFEQRDYSKRPPPLRGGHAMIDNRSLPLVFDFDSADSRVPFGFNEDVLEVHANMPCSEAYARMNMVVEQCENSEEISLVHHDMLLPNGIRYAGVRETGENAVVLGRRFLADCAWFHSHAHGYTLVAPSAFAFSESNLLAACALALSVLIATWATIVLAYRYEDEWIFNTMLLLEMFGYLLAGTVMLITVFGLDMSRAITNFLQQTSLPLLWLLAYLFLSGTLISASIIMHNVWPALSFPEIAGRHMNNVRRLGRVRNLRIIFFLGASVSALWLCFIEHHKNLLDLLYIIFLATLLCVSSGILTLKSFFHHKPFAVLQLFQTLVYCLFLFVFNLMPSMALAGFGTASAFALSGLYLLLLVMWPTVHFFAAHEITQCSKV